MELAGEVPSSLVGCPDPAPCGKPCFSHTEDSWSLWSQWLDEDSMELGGCVQKRGRPIGPPEIGPASPCYLSRHSLW